MAFIPNESNTPIPLAKGVSKPNASASLGKTGKAASVAANLGKKNIKQPKRQTITAINQFVANRVADKKRWVQGPEATVQGPKAPPQQAPEQKPPEMSWDPKSKANKPMYYNEALNLITTNPDGIPVYWKTDPQTKLIYLTDEETEDRVIFNRDSQSLLTQMFAPTFPDTMAGNLLYSQYFEDSQAKRDEVANRANIAMGVGAGLSGDADQLRPGQKFRYNLKERQALAMSADSSYLLPGQWQTMVKVGDPQNLQPLLLSARPVVGRQKFADKANRPVEMVMQQLYQKAKTDPVLNLKVNMFDWVFGGGLTKAVKTLWYGMQSSAMGQMQSASALGGTMTQEEWGSSLEAIKQNVDEVNKISLAENNKALGEAFDAYREADKAMREAAWEDGKISLAEAKDITAPAFQPFGGAFKANAATNVLASITPNKIKIPFTDIVIPIRFSQKFDPYLPEERVLLNEQIVKANEQFAISQKIINSGTSDVAEIEKAEQATRAAILIDIESGYATELLRPSHVNPYWATTFQGMPNKYEEFVDNLVAASMLKQYRGLGTHLTEQEITDIKMQSTDPVAEFMVYAVADPLNLIPFDKFFSWIPAARRLAQMKGVWGDAFKLLEKTAAPGNLLGKTDDELRILNKTIANTLLDRSNQAKFFIFRQAARSKAMKGAAVAKDAFGNLAQGVNSPDDFVEAVGNAAEAAKILNTSDDVVSVFPKLPVTMGAKQKVELQELGKLWDPNNWAKTAESALSSARNRLLKAAEATVRKASKGLLTEPEIIAEAERIVSRQLKPMHIAELLADEFRVKLINGSRIWHNSQVLDDGIIGQLAKIPGFKESKIGQMIRWTADANFKIMSGWYNAVLSLRPAWVIRNYQDNIGRFVISGGKWGSDFKQIVRDLGGIGQVPAETFQSMSPTMVSDPTSLIWRVFEEEWTPTSFVDHYRYRAIENYRGLKPVWNKDKKLESIARNIGNIFRGGLINPVKTLSQGTGDWNSFVEISFRLRLYHTKYMENLEIMKPILESQVLGRLRPELRDAGRAMLAAAGNDPVKMSELIKMKDNVLFSYLVPDSVNEIMKGVSPADRALFIHPIQEQLEGFLKAKRAAGSIPTDQELGKFMGAIIDKIEEYQKDVLKASQEALDNRVIDLAAEAPDATKVIDEVMADAEPKFRPTEEAFDLVKKMEQTGEKPDPEDLKRVLGENKVVVKADETPEQALSRFVKSQDSPTIKPREVPKPKPEVTVTSDVAEMDDELIANANKSVTKPKGATGEVPLEGKKSTGWSPEYQAARDEEIRASQEVHDLYRLLDGSPDDVSEDVKAAFNRMDFWLSDVMSRNRDLIYTKFPFSDAGLTPEYHRWAWKNFETYHTQSRWAQAEVRKAQMEMLKSGTFDPKKLDNIAIDYYKKAGIGLKFDNTNQLVEINFLVKVDGFLPAPIKKGPELNQIKQAISGLKGENDFARIVGGQSMTEAQFIRSLNIPQPNLRPVKVVTASEVAQELRVASLHSEGNIEDAVRGIVQLYNDDAGRTVLGNTNQSHLANILKQHLKGNYPQVDLTKVKNNLGDVVAAMQKSGVADTYDDFVDVVTGAFNANVKQRYQVQLPAIVKDLKASLRSSFMDEWGLPAEYVDNQFKWFDFRAEQWAKDTGKTAEEWWISRIAAVRQTDADYMPRILYMKNGTPVWFNPLETAIKNNLKDARYRSGMDVLKVLDGKPGVKSDAVEVSGLREWLMNITEKDLKGGFELENGKVINSLTPQDVLDYVNNHSLYMKEKNAVGQNLQFSGYSLTNPAEAGIGDPNTYFEYQFILPDYPKTGSHLDDNNVAWVRGFELDVDDWGHDARALHLDENQSDIHERARDNLKRIRWDLFKKYSTIEPGTKGFTENSVAAYKATLNKFLQSSEEVDNLIAQNLSFTDRELEAMANAGTIWSHPRIQQNIGSYSTVVERVGDTFPLDDLKQSAQKFLDELAWAEESTLDAARRSVPDISDPNAMKWLENQVDIDEMGLLKSGGYEVEGFTLGAKLEPNYPFKKTYPELAMKRMIRKAVDDGLDGLTWTTGAQQVSRYGDIKVSWEQVGENKWKIFLGGKHEGQSLGRELGEISSFEDIRNLNAQELSNSWAETLWKKIKSSSVPTKSELRMVGGFDPSGKDVGVVTLKAFTGAVVTDPEVSAAIKALPGFEPNMISDYGEIADNIDVVYNNLADASIWNMAPEERLKSVVGLYYESDPLLDKAKPFNSIEVKKYFSDRFNIPYTMEQKETLGGSYMPMQEGMENYYDKWMTEYLNKLGKKYGGVVEDVNVGNVVTPKVFEITNGSWVIKNPLDDSYLSERGIFELYNPDIPRSTTRSFASEGDASSILSRLTPLRKEVKVHGFKFTDEFKKWAGEAKPLYMLDKDGTKRAGIMFQKDGRGLIAGFLKKGNTPLDALHELTHAAIIDIDSKDWNVLSTWMESLPDHQKVSITGGEFRQFHSQFVDGTIAPENFARYERAQENINNAIVRTMVEETLPVSEEVRLVLAKIVKWVKEWYEKMIKGTQFEIEVPTDVRRVFGKMFGSVPDEPLDTAFTMTDDISEFWKTLQASGQVSDDAALDMTDPNTFIKSARQKASQADMSGDLNSRDYYNDIANNVEGWTNQLQDYLNAIAGKPNMTQKVPPIPKAKLPLEYQEWYSLNKEAVTTMSRSQKALLAWKDYLVDMTQKAVKGDPDAFFFGNQTDEVWEVMGKWADTAASDLQEMRNTAKFGGKWGGKNINSALDQMNDAMLDYTRSTTFDSFMRNIYPFWMFPSRSIPFWAKTLATHPQIAIWYQKYLMMSEKMQYQNGLITSTGEPLPSFRGYVKFPGTNIWINLTSAYSFRYVLNPIMGTTSSDNRFVSEEDSETGPMEAAVQSVYTIGQDYGFQVNPFLQLLPPVQNTLGDAVTSTQNVIPQLDLAPLNWREKLLGDMGRIKYPTLSNMVAAEVPWKDSLVENRALKDALQQIQMANGNINKQYQIAIDYRNMLTTVDEDGRPARATSVLWKKYERELEKQQVIQAWISQFAGVYGKPWTDADAALLQLRHENNLLRNMINNNIGAYLFDLAPESVTRYDDYIQKRYESPEGLLYSLSQAIRYVTDESGDVVKDPRERLEVLNERLALDVINEDYYRQAKELRMEFEAAMSKVPVGSPYDITQPIREAYYEDKLALDSNPLYANREKVTWSPINKPEDKMLDHYRFNWFQTLRGTFPPFDINKESSAEYAERKAAWEASLSKQANTLAIKYKLQIERDVATLFPLTPWGQAMNASGVAGVDLAERIIAQLMSETTAEGMQSYYRKNDTINDALMNAYDALYLDIYIADVLSQSGDRRAQALQVFNTKYPVSYLTPQLMAQWVNTQPDYAGKWTEAELTRAYGQAGVTGIEERQEIGKTPEEDKVSQAFDVMSWADPGKEYSALLTEAEKLGIDDGFVPLLYTPGGSSVLALPKNQEFLNKNLEILQRAALKLGIDAPTGAQLTLRIQARDENELMKEKAVQTLGPTLFEDMGVYYAGSYADQAEYRKLYPEKYAAIKKYSDFKDAFGKMYPIWKMFYDPDTKKNSTGGGSSSGGSSGGSNGYSSKSTAGLTVTGGGSLDLSYKLRDDFIQMGKRSTLFSNQLLSGSRLGSGGVAGKPTWPKELMDALGDLMMAEFIRSIQEQQPLSSAAVNYLSKLKINHPEWTEYIDELNKMVKEAQSSTQ